VSAEIDWQRQKNHIRENSDSIGTLTDLGSGLARSLTNSMKWMARID